MKLILKIIEWIVARIELIYLSLTIGFVATIAWSLFLPESISVTETPTSTGNPALVINSISESEGMLSSPENNPKSNIYIIPATNLMNIVPGEIVGKHLIFEPNISNSGKFELDRFHFIERKLNLKQAKAEEAIIYSHKTKLKERFKMMLEEIARENQIFYPDERIILEELKAMKN